MTNLSVGINLLESENIDVTLNSKYGDNCLNFEFKGMFTKHASEQATQVWVKEFEQNPGKNYVLVWDCTHMKNFEFEANNAWRRTVTQFSDQIDLILMVSGASLIRGAARIMANVANLNMKVYKSIEEIDSN